MDNNGKAFDEVRAILGRLDRSIDEARTKRLGPDDDVTPVSHPAPREQAPAPKAVEQAPPPGVAPAAPPRASKYGRAKPLRRNGEPEVSDAPSTGAWQKPEQRFDDDTMIG